MNHALIRSSSLNHLLTLGLFLCSSGAAVGSGQSKPPNPPDTLAIRQRIATILRERLNEGVILVNGVRAQTRTPPSQAAVEEIRRYGDSAVPSLTAYSTSKSERERGIAVEFLGLLGGRRIVAPLRKVIQKDPSPALRVVALRWISQVPSDSVILIIREAANTDADGCVRKTAKEILGTGTAGGCSESSVPFKD